MKIIKKVTLILSLFIAVASAEEFLLPNTDVLEFELKFTDKQKSVFFEWGRNQFEKYKKKDRLLAGKALALCKMLSDSDLFEEYFLSLSYGFRFSPKSVKSHDVTAEFIKLASGSEDEKMLAWYIFDYLYAADKVASFKKKRDELPRGNWEYLVPFLVNGFSHSTAKDPHAKIKPITDKIEVDKAYRDQPRHPRRESVSVNGLIVSSLSNHRSLGTTAKITAKVLDVKHDGQKVFLDEETGMNMKRSLSNAEIALSNRFPVLFEKNNIRVSFERRESHKDGNSAGVAFTLLLYSIYEDIELDDKVAVTGVIMPDLGVKAVGGVPSKVRGAHIKGIKYAVIPEENKAIVADMTLLYELSTIWRTQIFTANKFTDALKIARVDKDSKTKEAIERFSAIAEILDQGSVAIKDNRDYLMQELAAILKLTPNHESARILERFFKGLRPKRLSLYGSADLLFMVVDRTLRISVSEAYKTSEEAFTSNKSFLMRAGRKLDPVTAKFTSKLVSYINTMIKYRNLLENNILKDRDKIGTAFNLMDKEGDQLEATREELDKLWRKIAKKM